MIADIVTMVIVYALIPMLVNRHLKSFAVAKHIHIIIIILGFIHVSFSSITVHGINILNATPVDGLKHEAAGKYLALQMTHNNWSEVINYFKIGNGVYQIYNGLVYFLTGATMRSVVAINSLMAFWGGLALVRLIYHTFPTLEKSLVLPLIIIFPPSVIFWCGGNLKEGLMYWSICQVFANFLPNRGGSPIWRLPLFIIGMTIGGFLRPHIISIWIAGIFLIIMLERRLWYYAVIAIIAFPLMIRAMENLAGYEASFEKFTEQQDRMSSSFDRLDFGSNIHYGEKGPTFFVSGFVSLFFRPFPWEVTNVRFLLSMLEAWGITLAIILVWARMSKMQAMAAFKTPEIRVAMVVCVLFCVFFTNASNEGLLMRQKVQAFPALIALFAIPILQKRHRKQMYFHHLKNDYNGMDIDNGSDVDYPREPNKVHIGGGRNLKTLL